MTLPQNDDSLAKAAESIQMQAETAYYVIRNRGELTADAVRARLAQVWVRAADDLERLASGAGTDVEARKTQLLQRTFGTAGLPGDPASLAMSARDAAERVAQIDPMDPYSALQLLERADLIGDEVLARAVGARAYSDQLGTWGQVLDEFVEDRPAAASALAELGQLDQQSRVMGSFTYGWQFMAQKPAELMGLDDWKVRALAAQVQA
jgi:hypothetical protein